jgi:hypothetical protein
VREKDGCRKGGGYEGALQLKMRCSVTKRGSSISPGGPGASPPDDAIPSAGAGRGGETGRRMDRPAAAAEGRGGGGAWVAAGSRGGLDGRVPRNGALQWIYLSQDLLYNQDNPFL